MVGEMCFSFLSVRRGGAGEFQRQKRHSLSDLVHLQTMSVKIGKPAPDFKATAVVDGNFRDISLKEFKGKYVVLFFYPLDFTFVCPTGKSTVPPRPRTPPFPSRDHLLQRSHRRVSSNQLRTAGLFDRLAFQSFSLVRRRASAPFTHCYSRVNTSRKQGGLGKLNIPLIADKNMEISREKCVGK